MLDIQNIHVSYGSREVLKDISIRVSKGKIVALVGPNGAGKTTLIKAVSGLVRPTAGMIMVSEENIADLNEPNRAKQISVVPQAHQLGGAFTVAHTVMLGRTVHMGWLGAPSEKDRQRVQWAMSEICIEHLADRRVAELSGGEQQLVLLARALAQETPVLLLDEPTNHLDMKHKTDLLQLVKQLAKQEGLAMLMAIHDLNLVSLFADQVALLVDGELLHLGKPKEVLTPKLIGEAYQTNVDVFHHPDKGYPVIMPQSGE
ncbi:MAG: ABC transporter ATP-binding protein [Chloroflexota bacterium]